MSKFIRKHTILTILVVLGVIVAAIYFSVPKDESAAMTEIAVSKENITTYNSFVGNVTAASNRKVTSLASEQISEVFVEKGDSVKKGDILLKLKTDNIQHTIDKTAASIAQAKRTANYQVQSMEKNYEDYVELLDKDLYINYNSAKRGVESAKDAVDDADYAYEKYQDAYIRAGSLLKLDPENAQLQSAFATAEQMFNSADSALKQAEKALETAQDNYEYIQVAMDQQLASLELAVDSAKNAADLTATEMDYKKLVDTLEDYTIKAPCDGIITDFPFDEGDIISQGMPVAVISSLDKMEITVSVDEYSILNTHEGANVTIYIDSIERTYDGVITYVSEISNVMGGVSYYEAKVQFTPDEFVKSGMSVEVRLININETNVLALPTDAINYRDNNTAFVYVKNEEGKLEEKNITLGVSDGDIVEIESGLSENETIYYTPKVFDPYEMWANM